MKAVYRNIHPLAKIGVVALVALVSLIVFLIISAVLAIPLFGIDAFTEMISSSVQIDASNVALLKYFQTSQSIGLFIVPSLISALLFGKSIGNYLSLDKKPVFITALLAIMIVISVNPVINVLAEWNSKMSLPSWMSGIEEWMRQSEETATELTKLFVSAKTVGGLLFNILMIALIPAIGEEFLFRGIIQQILTEWFKNPHTAIWVTAVLFSALHLQFYGFLPRALLGAMFGYLLIWSGNLWLPVIAHFVNNGIAVIAYYLYEKGAISVDPDSFGTGSSYGIAAVISLILVVLLYLLYYRAAKGQQLNINQNCRN